MAKNSTVTITDVAATAGLSVSTISRVLNNKDDVAAETYARVRQIIDELGYTSSLAARSMRSRRSNVIGVLVVDIGDPFSIEVVRGIGEAIRTYSHDLLIYSSGRTQATVEAAWDRKHVRTLNGSITDGIIVVTPTSAHIPSSHPLVIIDPYRDTTVHPQVLSTNREGARSAMAHLLELGHRRIGFIAGIPGLLSSEEREQGYLEALILAGLAPDPALIQSGYFSRAGGFQSTRQLLVLEDPPTAIFAANDLSAIGAMEAALAAGRTVPTDLSVVGFDDIPEAANTAPPLTTVEQAIRQLGAVATEMLMGLLRGEAIAETSRRLATRLIVRGSTREPQRHA